jgi:hypothetical protein
MPSQQTLWRIVMVLMVVSAIVQIVRLVMQPAAP